MSLVTVDALLGQVEQLSFEDKLLLLEKIAHAVRSDPQAELKPSTKRVVGLHAGMGWMADDFDAPLGDSFWLGEESE